MSLTSRSWGQIPGGARGGQRGQSSSRPRGTDGGGLNWGKAERVSRELTEIRENIFGVVLT